MQTSQREKIPFKPSKFSSKLHSAHRLTWLCVNSGIASKLSAATVSNIMAAEPGVMLLSSSNEKLTSFLRRGSDDVADTSEPVVDRSHSWDKGLLVR